MKIQPAGFTQAAALPQIGVLFYVEAQFTTGTLRVSTWGAERSWNGHVWGGLGEILTVTPPREAEDSAPQRFEIALSGVRPDLRALALGPANVYRDRPITVWLQLVNITGAELDFGAGPVQPMLHHAGFMDELTIRPQDGADEIAVQCMTSRAGLDPAPATALFNDLTHRAVYPMERGLERQTALAGKPTTILTARFQRVSA